MLRGAYFRASTSFRLRSATQHLSSRGSAPGSISPLARLPVVVAPLPPRSEALAPTRFGTSLDEQFVITLRDADVLDRSELVTGHKLELHVLILPLVPGSDRRLTLVGQGIGIRSLVDFPFLDVAVFDQRIEIRV